MIVHTVFGHDVDVDQDEANALERAGLVRRDPDDKPLATAPKATKSKDTQPPGPTTPGSDKETN